MNEEVVQKLLKILACADPSRGSTPAEVEVAMRKAEELAHAHNIDLGRLREASEKQGKKMQYSTGSVTVGSWKTKRQAHHLPIWDILTSCFEVRVIGFGARRSDCVIIGETNDVLLAQTCYPWLCSVFQRLFREYQDRSGASFVGTDFVRRHSFYMGLRNAIISKHLELKKKRQQEIAGYALVLADKSTAVAAKTNELFPKLGEMKTKEVKGDPFAYIAGIEEGKKIKLNAQLT